jgi:hypothetical protein
MNKKTEPHKKHEQPAKQLLLKSLVLAIKLFVFAACLGWDAQNKLSQK